MEMEMLGHVPWKNEHPWWTYDSWPGGEHAVSDREGKEKARNTGKSG